jgi:hypothetical protein
MSARPFARAKSAIVGSSALRVSVLSGGNKVTIGRMPMGLRLQCSMKRLSGSVALAWPAAAGDVGNPSSAESSSRSRSQRAGPVTPSSALAAVAVAMSSRTSVTTPNIEGSSSFESTPGQFREKENFPKKKNGFADFHDSLHKSRCAIAAARARAARDGERRRHAPTHPPCGALTETVGSADIPKRGGGGVSPCEVRWQLASIGTAAFSR